MEIFYVWSDKKRDFVAIPEHKIVCPECGKSAADMLYTEVRPGDAMLECPCGEQFTNRND